ncbi:MAG: hypothetical protein AAGN66_08665 [Acidobacteriota bacterium]
MSTALVAIHLAACSSEPPGSEDDWIEADKVVPVEDLLHEGSMAHLRGDTAEALAAYREAASREPWQPELVKLLKVEILHRELIGFSEYGAARFLRSLEPLDARPDLRDLLSEEWFSADSAAEICRARGASQLKAPATAAWGTEPAQPLGGGRFWLDTTVDSQNSFGAMIRNRFRCAVEYQGDRRYTFLATEFDD